MNQVFKGIDKDFHFVDVARKMRYNRLGSTDMNVSHLSFGGSAIGGHYASVDEAEAISVVEHALRSGINYIDTAPWYGFGVAETILGKALKNIPRHVYYVATKVGRYSPIVEEMFDFSAENTLKSVEESLKKIGCDYLDLIQIHDLEFAPSLDIILNETLPTLLKIKEAGLVRHIGITGYPLHVLKSVVEKSSVPIDTVLSYCRCCLHDTSLSDYVSFFKSKGLGIIDAAGLGMGLYTDRSLPDWHPAPAEIKDACLKSLKYCQENGSSFSKLAMNFNLNQPGADTHLISCYEKEILQENLDVCLNGISENDYKVMDEIYERYFKVLKTHNWENVEVNKYKKKMLGRIK